jgi:DNA-binding IclR family transcriptional regulator
MAVSLSGAQHWLLGEMAPWGLVERGADGRYRLGMRAWRLGMASTWERDLRGVASPHAHALVAELGSSVAVAVLMEDRLSCLETIRGKQPSIVLSKPGDPLPLLATSAGKVPAAAHGAFPLR